MRMQRNLKTGSCWRHLPTVGRRLVDVWTVLDGSAAAEAQLGQTVNPKQLSVAPKATAVNAERNKSQQVGAISQERRETSMRIYCKTCSWFGFKIIFVLYCEFSIFRFPFNYSFIIYLFIFLFFCFSRVPWSFLGSFKLEIVLSSLWCVCEFVCVFVCVWAYPVTVKHINNKFIVLFFFT